MPNWFATYLNSFDLVRRQRPPRAAPVAVSQAQPAPPSSGPSALRVNLVLGAQWLAVLAGVLAKDFTVYAAKTPGGGFWSWTRFFLSLIPALMIFPAVYNKVMEKDVATLPVFVKCCSIFAMGFGYQSIIETTAQLAK